MIHSDTRFVVYMEGQGSEPTQALHGRDALTPVFDDLNRYQATMHFNGQSTISLDGDRATGETYCIALHPFTEAGERKLMIAWLRYGDTFVKLDGAWLFAERNLHVDWIETRPSHPWRQDLAQPQLEAGEGGRPPFTPRKPRLSPRPLRRPSRLGCAPDPSSSRDR